MSDKEFIDWRNENFPAIRIDYATLGIMEMLKWMQIAWQVATVRATEEERKLIVDILKNRYHELAQLKTDDNSDACWEDYNYSQKEIARLLKSLK